MAWFEHGTSRIYYEEQGTGEPVLLLPGWAGSINEFSALREALVAAGYKVIAADLPGSGRSEPQPRAYMATYYEEDARSFAALLQHLATGPTHLLGFSDGGEVELLLAATTRGVSRSVVTWGSSGFVPAEQLPMLDAMHNIIDSPIPPLQHFREYLVATYGEDNARTATQNFAGALRAIVASGGDISLSKVGNITCPVLLIAGEQDFIVSPGHVSQLSERIAGSEFLVAEGAGHSVHEDRAEWLEQIILDWLEKH
jgi:valacyclovir hydrolase